MSANESKSKAVTLSNGETAWASHNTGDALKEYSKSSVITRCAAVLAQKDSVQDSYATPDGVHIYLPNWSLLLRQDRNETWVEFVRRNTRAVSDFVEFVKKAHSTEWPDYVREIPLYFTFRVEDMETAELNWGSWTNTSMNSRSSP